MTAYDYAERQGEPHRHDIRSNSNTQALAGVKGSAK